MPLTFLIIGVVFVASAVNGTSAQLISLIKSDFTGQNNFIFWLVALIIIGAVGEIEELRPVSNAFLVLVILAIILANSPKGGVGVFTQLINQLNESQTT